MQVWLFFFAKENAKFTETIVTEYDKVTNLKQESNLFTNVSQFYKSLIHDK